MKSPKYRLTDETMKYDGHTLYRIECVTSFALESGKIIESGQKGGWIESERNLEQERKCWIDDEAMAYDEAYIVDDAVIAENVVVKGDVWIYGKASIKGSGQLSGSLVISGSPYQFVSKSDDIDDNTEKHIFDNAIFEDDPEYVWISLQRWRRIKNFIIAIGFCCSICLLYILREIIH